MGQPGAATLYYSPDRNEHMSLAKHFTAEKQVTKNGVTSWEEVHGNNHWLDGFYNACMSGHLCGARLIEQPREPAPRPSRQPTGLTMPDGRPFLVTERQD